MIVVAGRGSMEELIRRFGRLDGVSGFLKASEPPLHRLEDPYYAEWEVILDLMPHLLLTCRIRSYIDKNFPDLPIKEETLKDNRQAARIFQLIAFLSHAYVRGGQQEVVIDWIPEKLARPFKQTAEILGCHPIVNYSATALFNWALIDPTEPVSLDNIRIVNTISGSPDEAWFFMVPVAMEALGGPILASILHAQDAVDHNDMEALTSTMTTMAPQIMALSAVLDRMYENCLPQSFYKRVRPYFAGWTNDTAMPEGLHYGPGSPGEFYSGASAGQSPIFHVLDIALGIVHPEHPQDEETQAKATKVGVPGAFIREMRQYMLREHRECIEHLEDQLTIRTYVKANQENSPLRHAYNECVSALETFRSTHIRMVSFYIVAQAAKENKESQGTGGSNPIPLLKDLREHVYHAKI